MRRPAVRFRSAPPVLSPAGMIPLSRYCLNDRLRGESIRHEAMENGGRLARSQGSVRNQDSGTLGSASLAAANGNAAHSPPWSPKQQIISRIRLWLVVTVSTRRFGMPQYGGYVTGAGTYAPLPSNEFSSDVKRCSSTRTNASQCLRMRKRFIFAIGNDL